MVLVLGKPTTERIFTPFPREQLTRIPIVLKKPSLAERRARLSLPLRIITSPKTTAVLGATLAGLLVAPAAVFGIARGAVRLVTPKTLPQALLIPSAAVVLKTSPTARGAAKGLLKGDPGRVVAGLIEKAPTGTKKTAEKTGLLGLGAAVVAGLGIGAIATKKVKSTIEKIPIPSIPKLPKRKKAVVDVPTGLLPAVPSLTPTTQPLGAVQQVPEVIPVIPVEKVKPISIKNTFNPTIDIKFSKSRKFINQQILIKG